MAWEKKKKKESDDVKYMYGLYEHEEGFFAEMRKCPEGV